MPLMTIGEFSERTRLSPKALRLYDELGLVVPCEVDANSGYRYYAEEQIPRARLVGLLRQLDMPLAEIAAVLELNAGAASDAVEAYWSQVEERLAERRSLVEYIRNSLKGVHMSTYDVEMRPVPERKILSIQRHVHAENLRERFHADLAQLRALAPALEGIDGAPFQVFYNEVSADSDGPWELCVPVAVDTSDAVGTGEADVTVRIEPAHDEAFIRVPLKDLAWPGLVPAIEELWHWVGEQSRPPGGAVRQIFIAHNGEVRQMTPDLPFCDVAIPLG